MHAPDGFYSVSLCISLDVVSLGIIAYCVKKVWRKIDRRTLLLAASIGALVFSIQLANFSVTRGSSCHCMGGVFSAILLGPYLSTIMVSLMHLVQFFVFQDGGLLSLGPNLLTLAIISTFLGYYLYKTFRSLVIEPYGTYIGAFISSWLTLLITAIAVCLMLYISGIDSLAVTLGPMVGPHVLAGIMEGLISMLLLALIYKISPDFLTILSGKEEEIKNKNIRLKMRRISFFLLTLALIIGIFLSPFASRQPKGLEKLAIDHGFAGVYERVYYNAPFPNYSIPNIKSIIIGRLFSGSLGVIFTFLLCWGIGIFLTAGATKINKVEANLVEVLSP